MTPDQPAVWRPIATAPKDGTRIWAAFRPDIYPALMPQRPDLERWSGRQAPLRHEGLAPDGFDVGWHVALPVGAGGFPDEWIAGWMPLPPPPGEGDGATLREAVDELREVTRQNGGLAIPYEPRDDGEGDGGRGADAGGGDG